MKAELVLNCKECIEDVSLEITIRGKVMPTFREVMGAAQEKGWRIGRDCYCSSCYQALPAHCGTCGDYEGNKSMGSPICRRDGNFAAPTDYCKHHRPFGCAGRSGQGYKNPVPTLE